MSIVMRSSLSCESVTSAPLMSTQETQERRVLDLAVVAVLQLLQIVRALERLRLLDEAVEGLVDEVHVVLKLGAGGTRTPQGRFQYGK